jgi:hypothetical protein
VGTHVAIFKALTLAPADLFIIKEKNEEREKTWSAIVEHT